MCPLLFMYNLSQTFIHLVNKGKQGNKMDQTQFKLIFKLSFSQIQFNNSALTLPSYYSHLHPALSKWRPLCGTLPLRMSRRVDRHPLS